MSTRCGVVFRVIVKLVNDRGVFYDGEQHATLSIGRGLTLSNAVPVFKTDRRHRIQAEGEPNPSLGLGLFFELTAPDGNGAALCNKDPNVEHAYLEPIATLPATLP